MKIHQMSVAEALASVRSAATGLAAAEAAARLREYGPNRIEAAAREGWVLRLLREYSGLFSVILWLAAGLAFLAAWNDPGQGMDRVGYAVVAVILVSGLFSFWQETRVEQTLDALRGLLPPRAGALRDGGAVTLPAAALVPGDVILLGAGDNVPADCRVIEAFGLRVNRATVTGEALPQSCTAAPCAGERHTDSPNVLLAGTSVVAGRGRAVVFATGRHTVFGQIARLTQTAGAGTSPLRREIAHLSRVIAVLALATGLAFFVAGRLIGVPFWHDVLLAIGIIIALVPEALLPTLTLSLVLAAQRLARKNVLIRHLPSVETLGAVTVICTDKTGTLTEGRMQPARLLLGLDPVAAATLAAQPALAAAHPLFFAAARDCQDLTEHRGDGRPEWRGDPLDEALAALAAPFAPAVAGTRIDEWPFDSARMRQSVLLQVDGQRILYCKGAVETVLPRCRTVALRDREAPLDAAARAAILRAQAEMSGAGLRVIALAARRPPADCPRAGMEEALVFCGLAGLADPPRAEVDVAVARCRAAGIRIIMVTGDHPRTALAIARTIGLVTGDAARVLTGGELDRLSAAQLQLALDAPEIVFARVAADQKMRIVEALKQKGHVVAVTGDGVNDAPALRTAHIGIGMGRSGTDVAREAADMILLDDHFASIVLAVEEGRAVFQNIRKFLTYVLAHNVAELGPSLAFALWRIPLPLTAVQALAVDMGTDSLSALGLGVEPGHPDAMRRPPRAPSTRLLTPAIAGRALGVGLIEAAAGLAAFLHVLDRGGWHYGDPLAAGDPRYREATAACLAAIVLLQGVNALLCRSALRSLATQGLAGNALLLGGMLWGLALLAVILYTPAGNAFFGTAPLSLDTWAFLLPWAGVLVAAEEARKGLARRRLRRRRADPES